MSGDDNEYGVQALDKADSLARGAALKWASGIFCRSDQLTRLGHYRRRETQRNNSIQSRLKSTVQSYVEGVDQGVTQLRTALSEVQGVHQALREAQDIWTETEKLFTNLQPIRQVVAEHVQLTVVIQSLPYIYTVPELVCETRLLIESHHLLDAHIHLRDLESLRDDVLYRLQRVGPSSDMANDGSHQSGDATELVQDFFSGVHELSNVLGCTLFSLASSAVTLSSSDPALLVSAVRIIEREEYLDAEESRGPPQNQWMPPGRPKHWRDSFFQALERGVCERLMGSGLEDENVNPTGLARHLKELQGRVLSELQMMSSAVAPCVPPHYELCRTVGQMCHRAISRHLRDILNLELPHPALYPVLHWAIIVYPSEDMMGHPDLSPEVDLHELGPIISSEVLEEQLNRYTRSVRACVTQWIQKALEVESTDWTRDQEPDRGPDGMYMSSMLHLIMQMLAENIQLASVLGSPLEGRVRGAAVHEMDTCLVRLREALVKYGIEHVKNREAPKFYVPYLLATINGCTALSPSISYLQPEDVSSPLFRKAAPNLQSSLDKTQKKAGHLLLDEVHTELQHLLLQIPSRPWLLGSDVIHQVCEKLDNFGQYLSQAEAPMCQFLKAQTERILVIEYVKGLMQNKLVCKNSGERLQFAERMLTDAEELRSALARMGLEDSTLCAPLLLSLQELFALKDPSLLSLEVSGLMTKYPDISDDHVLALLELRGDVGRDVRHNVLNMMRRQAPPLPEDYHPIFMSIPAPAPPPPFCLHPSSCA
ncbi:exocyst complex component 3-like protein [Discoglossus pictus]